ncbi:MAG: hypothetical protein U1E54_01405 [Candidatus Levybacteria bacterium]|nr:hypothetical protein [Candidatus Levybacteria bacterium]
MAVFVPSTKKRKKISEKEFKKRILETKRFFSRFGGYTKTNTVGGFVEEGSLIEEKVVKVESYSNVQDYKQVKAELLAWIRSKKNTWQQFSIGFEFEEDFHLIG